MFRWSGDDQDKQFEKNECFPLNTVYLPMRSYILQIMPMSQLVKMCFESLEAAKDIEKANVSPKTISIHICTKLEVKVEFQMDGYSVQVATRSSLDKNKEYTFFKRRTFLGELLECTAEETGICIIVPDIDEIKEAVKIVYTHLCFVFKEALTTNLFVSGDHYEIYPEICAIRDITAVNQLELSHMWRRDELQKKVFEDILKKTTYKRLGIFNEPPKDSEPMRISADFVYFRLDDPNWLTAQKFREIDARKINMFTVSAERLNVALKNWSEGTAFRRLESISVSFFDHTTIGDVKEGLPMREWKTYRRPAYFCLYKTNANNEKVFSKFLDLRDASDMRSEDGRIGTLVMKPLHDQAQLSKPYKLMFIVWTKDNRELVREAPGKIREALQEHEEHSAKCRKDLENQDPGWLPYNTELRALTQQRQQFENEIAGRETVASENETIGWERRRNAFREQIRELRENRRRNQTDGEILALERQLQDFKDQIRMCNEYLEIIADNPFN